MAAALVVHTLVLWLAPQRRLPNVEDARPQVEPAADTFDIEQEPAVPAPVTPPPVTPPPVTPPPAAATPEPTAPSPPPANAKLAKAITEPKPVASPAPSQGEPGAPPTPETPPAPPSPGTAGGPGKPGGDEYGPPGGDVVGLPPGLDKPIWSLPGVIASGAPPMPAPTVASARPVDPNIAGQVLGGSLHNKDKAAGVEIPGASVVSTALRDALRSSTPLDARATFEVKLGGDGSVEGIRMVSASAGDASTWARVVSAARGSLASRTLQMGGEGKGVTVIVKVESSVEYPAGSKQKIDFQPVCANEVFEQIEAAIQAVSQGVAPGLVRGVRDDKGTFIPYTEMDDDQRRRFCIPIGIRGKGDASNIGAHATNVVRSSFKVVRAGEKALQPEAVLPVDTRVPWARADPTKTRPTTPPPLKKKKKKWR
jgi:hypothetical protein